MKKNLLCLFLFTCLNFYAQVRDMVHCAGDTAFNLTSASSLLIGNFKPTETTVSYHITSEDAINGTNAISNPTNFIVPQNQNNAASQTIYARINHLGEITTNYFSLIVNAPFLVSAIVEPINCEANGTIKLQVLGGKAPFTCNINNTYYSTSDPNTNNFSYYPTANISNINFSNLVAGTYNISLRDATGCITTGTWTIESSSIIPLNTPTATVLNVTCNGDRNGAVTINATGGKSPLSYSLDNGANYVLNNTLTNLAPRNYTISVKDANGCTKVISANVTEPMPLQMAADITKPMACINNATVTLAATGGTSPYLYSKDRNTFSPINIFNDLGAGTYSFSVKDKNGCVIEYAVTITPLVPLIATITKTDVQCNGFNNGSITVNATGGQLPYTYRLTTNGGSQIVGNQTKNIFSGLSAGSYRVEVIDANGCVYMDMAPITQPLLPLTVVCSVKNQTITINATGGSGSTIKYAISPDLNQFSENNVFSGLTPGSYTVLTEDVNGCYIMMDVTVDPPAPLINGLGQLILQFKSGQTLADLIVTGQNIKWYIHKYLLTRKTSRTSETPLPLSTVLVDGTTYYASQTVNGIESTERLEVTVKSGTLGTDDFAIKDLAYYPNPVKNILTISNTSIIDEVILMSVKGETLLTKQINNLRSEIDLSSFSNGIYLLNIKSEGTEKTVKLIKE